MNNKPPYAITVKTSDYLTKIVGSSGRQNVNIKLAGFKRELRQ